MEGILPILQGLSTPVLLVVGWLVIHGNKALTKVKEEFTNSLNAAGADFTKALHDVDKRLAVVETQITEHRKTEVNGNVENTSS